MSEEGVPPRGESPKDIQAELERVRAERNELEARVETLEAPKRHRLRRVFAPILVALAVIVFTITVPAAWGARTVLNTDRYVATVAPLAQDPAVQQAIATRLTDEVFEALNVQDLISSTLSSIGERATLLAGPLTNALRGFVQDQVLKVVQSDAFETFWVQANRFVHTQVLAVLRGENQGVDDRYAIRRVVDDDTFVAFAADDAGISGAGRSLNPVENHDRRIADVRTIWIEERTRAVRLIGERLSRAAKFHR